MAPPLAAVLSIHCVVAMGYCSGLRVAAGLETMAPWRGLGGEGGGLAGGCVCGRAGKRWDSLEVWLWVVGD